MASHPPTEGRDTSGTAGQLLEVRAIITCPHARAKRRIFTANFRRSAGSAGPLLPAPTLRWRRKCGTPGRDRTRSPAPRRRLPLQAIRSTKSSSVSITLPDGARLADRAGARRIDVERALRLRAMQPVGLVEHADDKVAPLLEHGVVLGDEILRPVERFDRGPLRDGVRDWWSTATAASPSP